MHTWINTCLESRWLSMDKCWPAGVEQRVLREVIGQALQTRLPVQKVCTDNILHGAVPTHVTCHASLADVVCIRHCSARPDLGQ